MPASYDGDIKLSVSLDPKSVVKSADELTRRITKIFEASEGKNTDAGFKKILVSMDKTNTKAIELRKNLDELLAKQEKIDEAKAGGASAERLKELEETIAVLDKIRAYGSFGGEINIPEGMDFEDYSESIVNEYEDLKASVKEYSSVSDEEYAQLVADIDSAKMALSGLNNEMRVSTDRATHDLQTKYDLANAEQYLTDAEFEEADAVARLAQAVRQSIADHEGLKGKIRELGATIKGFAMSQITAPFVRIGESLVNIGKRSQSADFDMKKLLRTFLRYGLGVRSLFFLFRKLRSAVKEGFENLKQFNGGVNPVATTLNNLTSSLTTLKNAWATAFAPILQMVAPILQTLISLLISAANAVAQFFAALGGSSKVIKATKAQTKLGKAIGGTGAAADKAKGQLAAFDELNLLDQDSGGGGGGGGGAGDLGGLDFEEVDIENKFKDLADLIKKCWENADFTELGTMVGEKIKEGLDLAYTWLTGPVKDFAWRLSRSIATFLNGVIEVPELGVSLGKVIGAALNDAFLFVNTFLKEFHWASLGKLIGETLLSAFREFDWGNISRFLSGKFIAIMDTIRGFIEAIDWAQLPKDIWDAIVEFVNGIDVQGLATSFGSLLGAVFTALANVGTTLWQGVLDTVFSIGQYFDKYVKEAEEAGDSLILGFLKGIWDAIKNVGKWIWDNVCQPVIDAFHEHFQINSPSKVMEEIGAGLIEGLFNGITSLIDTIKQLWEDLKAKTIEIFQSLGNKLKEIWNGVKTTIINTITALKTNLVTIWNNIKTSVISVIEGFRTGAVNIFNDIKTKLTNVVNTIKENLKTAFTNVKTTVTGIFDGMKTAVVNTFSGMWNGIKGFINSIIGGIEKMANGVIMGINTVIRALNGLSFNIPDWVPKLGGKSFGLHLNTLGGVSIPRLAQGAVIPPNEQFLAVLGDQKSGTNIEAPLDTIKQAVREVVDGNSSEEVVQLLQELISVVAAKQLTISKREIGDSAIDEINRRTRRTGSTPILG